MRNGYDQFFRKARQQAAHGGAKAPSRASFDMSKGPRFEVTAEQLEEHLRRKAGVKKAKRRKKSFPWSVTLMSAVGALLTGWAMLNAEEVEHVVKNLEISWIGSASAEEAPKKEAAPAKKEGDVQSAETPAKTAREPSATEIDHLSKLNDREKELDAREQELGRQESELVKMKEELESRLRELDGMRAKISEMLQDRVKADDQKVETLVQMYSNMKAPQAAKVFETMDEDLAVEILGRMKKKNAADIMNLLKPEKAQTFSEKYAGYKRK